MNDAERMKGKKYIQCQCWVQRHVTTVQCFRSTHYTYSKLCSYAVLNFRLDNSDSPGDSHYGTGPDLSCSSVYF